jgi:hypothetical protein
MAVTAESLFDTFFAPLYPEGARDPAGLARARAVDANPAKNPSILAHLDDAAATFEHMAPAVFGVSAGELGLDRSDASVHRLSRALTAARRDAWMEGGAGTPESALFNVVVHGAAYVGACVVASHGGAWAVRRPLWESLVTLESRAGVGDLPVFHWWLKSLSDDALGGALGTLADRYRAYVEVPCADVGALPVIAPPDRRLPRLEKIRYDVFYKYLKAHLPELKDVGEHFPSPERFGELGFRWIAPRLVGGGRMLLVWGPAKAGVQAFWLTAAGFEKAACFEHDAGAEPTLAEDGDKLVFTVKRGGADVKHEVLWWGP